LYEQIASNKRKSLFFVLLFFAFFLVIGWSLGYLFGSSYFGVIIALLFAFFYFLLQYYKGSKLILFVSKARKPTKEEGMYLLNVVEGLAIAAGIPKPEVYVIDDDAINAFATGRDPNHAAIVVTTGALKKLNRLELEGVIAHEMSHIKNYDIRLLLVMITLVGSIILLSDIMRRAFLFSNDRDKNAYVLILVLALSIIAPVIAYLIHFAVSRQREFLADATGALLTRYPEGLASALEKIKKDVESKKDTVVDSANRSTAALFIANPLPKTRINNLFSTHPPLEERIKRLRSM